MIVYNILYWEPLTTDAENLDCVQYSQTLQTRFFENLIFFLYQISIFFPQIFSQYPILLSVLSSFLSFFLFQGSLRSFI